MRTVTLRRGPIRLGNSELMTLNTAGGDVLTLALGLARAQGSRTIHADDAVADVLVTAGVALDAEPDDDALASLHAELERLLAEIR